MLMTTSTFLESDATTEQLQSPRLNIFFSYRIGLWKARQGSRTKPSNAYWLHGTGLGTHVEWQKPYPEHPLETLRSELAI